MYILNFYQISTLAVSEIPIYKLTFYDDINFYQFINSTISLVDQAFPVPITDSSLNKLYPLA